MSFSDWLDERPEILTIIQDLEEEPEKLYLFIQLLTQFIDSSQPHPSTLTSSSFPSETEVFWRSR